jgi:hypothetical protein
MAIKKEENSLSLSSKVKVVMKKKAKTENFLNNKIKLEDIKEIIYRGKNLRVNVEKELESIETCLREAEDWDALYLLIVRERRPFEEIITLMNNLENILVCTPVMYQALDLVTDYQSYSTKSDYYIKNSEFMTETIFKSIANLSHEWKNDYIDISLSEKIQKLISIKESIDKEAELIRASLLMESDITKLKKLKEKIDNSIHKLEIEKIEQKIFYLQNLENLLDEKNNMESLSKIENLLGEYNIQAEKYHQLILFKKNKIESLNQEVENQLNLNDIPEESFCKKILQDAEENKISLLNEKQLLDYIDINKWYDDVKKIYMQENFDQNLDKKLDLSEQDLIQIIERVKGKAELLKGNARSLYNKLFYTIWRINALKIKKIIHGEEGKFSLLDLKDLMKSDFNELNSEEYFDLKSHITNFNTKLEEWERNYSELNYLVYDEGLKELDKLKDLNSNLTESVGIWDIIINSDRRMDVNNITQLIKVSENIISILNMKNSDTRENIAIIKQLIKDSETFLNGLGLKIENIHWYKEYLKEEEKFNFWMEQFSQYLNLKRNNSSDKIDLFLLQVLIEESKKLIGNVQQEVDLLKKDLAWNKDWIDQAKNIVEISDSLNNIDALITNEENLKNLYYLFSTISSVVCEKSLVESIRSLEWASRSKLLLREAQINNSLNYRTAFRATQEANSLKHFPEIKKKDFYNELMRQVTLAKSIKDITETLKNPSHTKKQITEEQFDKIITDFFSKCIVDLPEEKEIIANFLKQKEEFNHRHSIILSSRAYLTEAEKFLIDLKKFAIKLEKLSENFEKIISESKILQRDIKKLLENHKIGKVTFTKEKVDNYYQKVLNNPLTFPEGDQLLRMVISSEGNVEKLKEILKTKSKLSEDEIYESVGLLDSIEVHNFSQERQIRRELWMRKADILLEKPSYNLLKNLQFEAKEISLHEVVESKDKYAELLQKIKLAEEIIIMISQTQTKDDLEEIIRKKTEEAKLDLNSQIVEQEMRIAMNKVKSFIGQKRYNEEIQNPSVKKQYTNEETEEQNTNKLTEVKNDQNKLDTGTIAASRSRRNINIKIDKDYYYDKDFIENFGNKVTNKTVNIKKDEIIENYAEIEEHIDTTSNIVIEEKSNVNTLDTSLNPNISLLKTIKDTTRKNSVSHFEKILSENILFAKEGKEFIQKKSKELEEDLWKSYPHVDSSYKNAYKNMTQTVKELEKYKKVSNLIVRDKLNLVKVSKFPYGNKYFEKLKKIEEGTHKPKEEKNPSSTKKDTSLEVLMKEMDQLYSSINKTNKKEVKSISSFNNLNLNLNEELNMDELDDDNNSLRSLSDREEVRFSPSNINLAQETNTINTVQANSNTNYYLTTKESSVQSPSSPHLIMLKETSNTTGFNQVDVTSIGKTYDPFNPVDEEEGNKKTKSKSKFPIFYDPTKKSKSEDKANKIENTQNTTQSEPAEDSTLQIWKGKLSINKLVDVNGIMMLTTHPISFFQNMVAPPVNINISSKAKLKEVIPYIEKYLSNKSKPVITGWLEVDNEGALEEYKKLAEEYEKNERSGFIQLNDDKFYVFTLPQKFQKFYKVLKSKIKLYHKFMTKLEKIIVFCIIRKGEENIGNDKNLIQPLILKPQEDMENAKMSPLTSEGEEDNEEKEGLTKLHQLLASDNPQLLEEYVNKEFANLGQDEIIEKLMELDEDSRTKLINFIVEYQQRENKPEETNQDFEMKNELEEINSNNQTDNIISDYGNIHKTDEDKDYQTIQMNQTQMNEHLSYLGFSGSNTDLLLREVYGARGFQSQSNTGIVNEDQLKQTMIPGQLHNYQVGHPMTSINPMQYAMNPQFFMNSYQQQIRQMMMQGANMQNLQQNIQNLSGMPPQNMNMIPQYMMPPNQNPSNISNLATQNQNYNPNQYERRSNFNK